jgi:hypothetical protein
METMTFNMGHLVVSASIAGSCGSATNAMVTSAWLMLKVGQGQSRQTECIFIHIVCNFCQGAGTNELLGLHTNDVGAQCVIQTDTNLFVGMQRLVDNLPFCWCVLVIVAEQSDSGIGPRPTADCKPEESVNVPSLFSSASIGVGCYKRSKASSGTPENTPERLDVALHRLCIVGRVAVQSK